MNEAKALTLEAGKYYRTRDGKKAFAGYIMEESPFNAAKPMYPVSGWIEGEEFTQCWNLDGSLHSSNEEHKKDLVSEWVEPKRIKGWLNLFEECVSSVLANSKADADVLAKAARWTRIACIEIDVLEGQGLNGEAA